MDVIKSIEHVAAVFVAAGPIAVAIGMLGHALVALGGEGSKIARVGKALEGIGTDWKRVAEAFKPKPAPVADSEKKA